METLYKTPHLYKKDTSGNLRVWSGEAFTDDQGIAYYQTIAGRLHGKQKKNVTEAKASAKLTAEEAAVSKIKSSEASKLKSGYFDDAEKAKDYKPNKLMILHKWPDFKERIDFPCLVQPKLDGVCAGYMDDPNDPHFKSRENNRFDKLDDKAQEIKRWLDAHHGIDRDRMDAHGELYVHGLAVGELIEGIKGSNESIRKAIEFCVFDFMPAQADAMWYKNRLKNGMEYYGTGEVTKPFRMVKTRVATNEEQVNAHYKSFVQEGYEGLIVCNTNGQYEYERRTYNKLKYKQLFSEEFEIVGFDVENNGSDKLIMFKCVTDDGKVFKVRPKWDHAKRSQAYADQVAKHIDYVGSDATVEYRSLTQYNTPFHPVLIAVRDYE